jgi:MFS family permease
VRRWVVLAVGTFVQTSQAAVYAGLAVIAPDLRDRFDLSLTQIGALFGISGVGGLLTLLAWGIAADRVGERATATVGLLGAGGALVAAALASSYATLLVFLFLTTALSASTNTATGRAVTSWFPRGERGLALGIRQTAIPLGGFSAAFVLPPIVDHGGSRAALLTLAGFSFAAAIAAAATMAEGPVRSLEDEAAVLRHPLRDGRIWRLSTGSAILVLTQATVTGFVVLFLESQRGFSHGVAAAVLGGMNAIAIVGRLGSGRLSDRIGSRVELMRRVSFGTALFVGAVAALAGASAWLLVPALVLGGGLSMSWNALSVAATVEAVGPTRSGAALGLQQTMLQLAIVVAPLVFAPFVAATSWRAGFAAAAACPLAAIVVLRRLGG